MTSLKKIQNESHSLNLVDFKDNEIIAQSNMMREVIRIAFKLASLKASNILILGESGTGKGLLTKFIHLNSRRKGMPFIQINCAALPENLLEAELFGYEKGAFTGASEQGKMGLFELANGGTLFLDEIGDLSLHLQAKLLKYLDDNEIMRLGGIKSRKLDCTIVAATNRILAELVKKNRFRQDLFYRLNTFTVTIPPLRKRPEDIFSLTYHYLHKYNEEYGLNKKISPEALEMLQTYAFPGNVRELQNIIKKALIIYEGDIIDDFIEKTLKIGNGHRESTDNKFKCKKSLNDELFSREKEILKYAMIGCKSTRELAVKLGISQATVVRKMKKHGFSFN